MEKQESGERELNVQKDNEAVSVELGVSAGPLKLERGEFVCKNLASDLTVILKLITLCS